MKNNKIRINTNILDKLIPLPNTAKNVLLILLSKKITKDTFAIKPSLKLEIIKELDIEKSTYTRAITALVKSGLMIRLNRGEYSLQTLRNK